MFAYFGVGTMHRGWFEWFSFQITECYLLGFVVTLRIYQGSSAKLLFAIVVKYNVGVDLNYVTIKINETKNMCENVELSLG